MPRIPRLPFVPDPLGRIDIPSNLGSITTVGQEAQAEIRRTAEKQLRLIVLGIPRWRSSR